MIKYYQFPEKRVTIGVLTQTKYDAVAKISKIFGRTKSMCFDPDNYLMPGEFRAYAKCDPRDTWDPEEGKRIVKEKVMNRYYNSLDKRMNKFYNDVDTMIRAIEDQAW